MKKAFFIGVNLLGDLLCTTPTTRAFKRMHPDTFITYIVHNAPYCRVLDANPDINLVLYNEELYMHGEKIYSEEWFYSLPIDIREPVCLYRFNIHELCRTTPDVFNEHISTGFSKFLSIPIDSVRPVVFITPEERQLAKAFVRKPYIVFSMHSTSKVIGSDGELTVKDWPTERWLRLAEHIHSWGEFGIIAIGSELVTGVHSPYFRNLYGLPIKIVAALLQDAACVVTIEGGISHLCHAVDAPMVVIFSKYVPISWAYPEEASCCRIIYDDPQSIPCEEVIAAVKFILDKGGHMT